MAKKVMAIIKLQIPAGKATPAPPVGPALGQHGVNIMQFVKEYNARTANDVGTVIPWITSADRSLPLSPDAARQGPPAQGRRPNRAPPGPQPARGRRHARADREIARLKMKDLNAVDIEGP